MINNYSLINKNFEKLLEKITSKLITKEFIYLYDNIESIRWYIHNPCCPIELKKIYSKYYLIQKIKREYFQNVLKELNKINIPFIGLKGIFFESLYYPEKNRIYSDIDILIKPHNCKKILSQLLLNNYNLKKNQNPLKTGTLFYNNKFLLKHFNGYYLNHMHAIDLNSSDNYINIEIHSNFNINTNFKFNMSAIWERSKFIKLENGISFYNLEKYDYSLYLINHLVNHIGYINYYTNKYSINLQMLNDIFIFLDSFHYDFDELFNRAINYNLLDETYFTIHLYDSIMNKNILSLYSPHFNNKLYEKLCEINIQNLILGDFSDTNLYKLNNINQFYSQNQLYNLIQMKYNISKLLKEGD